MREKTPLIEVRKVKKYFKVNRRQQLKALDDISFVLNKGDRFAVVGESGCGKSTLGKVLLRLHDASSGAMIYHGKTLSDLNPSYVMKEVKKLPEYQKKASLYYQESLKHEEKLHAFRNQLEEIDAEGSEKESKKHSQLEKKILKLEFDVKEARKNSSRQLREGAKICGSLILVKEIDEISSLYEKAARNLEKVFLLKKELKKEREESLGLPEGEALSASKEKMKELMGRIAEAKAEGNGFLAEAESYKGKTILPIHERAQFEHYLDRLERHKIDSIDLTKLTTKEMRMQRKDMQMIFQDPAASLDPRMTIGKIIEEGLLIHTDYNAAQRKKVALDLIEKVGLKAAHYDSYPNTISGGQKQRVGIAKALALNPDFLILDESVSALDVSVQAQILKLLTDLHEELDLTYLFITHDLGVVKHFCDRLMVMYLGYNFEYGSAAKIFEKPMHPYTQSLLASVPRLRTREDEREEDVIRGEIPSPINAPPGCPFNTRCPHAMEVCRKVKPKLILLEEDHSVACHLFSGQENAFSS
ncbi:MAG: ATP-binding cassette domain-containing protein [Clostridia bacterium]|nr:ATP-binding cassette domain-containing protein [Clostridia bacterium]